MNVLKYAPSMNHGNLMQVKEARPKRPYIVRFLLYELFKIGKFTDKEIRLVVDMGWKEGEMENDS